MLKMAYPKTNLDGLQPYPCDLKNSCPNYRPSDPDCLFTKCEGTRSPTGALVSDPELLEFGLKVMKPSWLKK